MRLLVPFLLITASVAAAQRDSGIGAQQLADGSWTDYRETVVAKTNTPRPNSELRTTSLILLCKLGDGSTMRSGPYKGRIKRGIVWMRKQIDAKGRIAMRSDPQWFTDHALACFALAEATCLSRYRTLRKNVVATSSWLLGYLRDERTSASQELLFWSQALASAMHDYPKNLPNHESKAWSAEFVPIAKQLQRVIGRRKAKLRANANPTEIERAMSLYDLVRSAEKSDSPAVLRALKNTLERCRDLQALPPMALAIYSFAFYQSGGGAAWKTWQKRIPAPVVKTQYLDGEARGTWRAKSEAIGPLQTTAWNIITLECYYRYCRLQLAR